ncbi:arginine repressor [Streptosporangium sp. NPDC002524]|uniref:arginine repressor n=1 Tax=Streptosporangium sp. NPDC002524 TaxID=3154537 RepID=UPI003328931B
MTDGNSPDPGSGGVSGKTPPTKETRQAYVRDVLAHHAVRSQTELARHLAARGLRVAQATISRDLLEIGAVRLRAPDGRLVYVAPKPGSGRGAAVESPDARLTRLARKLLVSVDTSNNVVILHTPPGAARYLASAVDQVHWHCVLGTVAGDDSVVVVSRDPGGGRDLAARLLGLLDGAASA